MRAVIQRVKQASVTVNHNIISSIEHGLCVLIGITHNDTIKEAEYIAKKLLTLRLWPNSDNSNQSWHNNVVNQQYSILCISQFTLYADIYKSKNKPDFRQAMSSDSAKILYQQLLDILHKQYPKHIYDGQFGAMMDVSLVNDGPVTIIVDTDDVNINSGNSNNKLQTTKQHNNNDINHDTNNNNNT